MVLLGLPASENSIRITVKIPERRDLVARCRGLSSLCKVYRALMPDCVEPGMT